MRIAKKIMKFVLFFVLVYCVIYVLMDQQERITSKFLKTYLDVDGYVLLILIVISAILCVVTPLWDVGKYLNTKNAEKISAFTRRYQRGFLMLFFGFLGALFLTTTPQSFPWWAGLICVIASYLSIGNSFFTKRKLDR